MVRRSRELWDEARRPGAPKSALLRAILYELQPFRFSSIDTTALELTGRTVGRFLVSFTTETMPSFVRGFYNVLRGMTLRQWCWVGGIVAYYYGVRYMHRVLDAGPMVLILSALVAIFTIGLDDNSNGDGVSAYSVFNRGFQRILGDIDVEALVAQHVGGAMGMAGMGLNAQPQAQDNNDAPPPQQPAAQGVARRPAAEEEGEPNNNDNADRPRARKSGKKARRANLEQRRELQRQRQAAQAMGFAGDGGPEEQMAMQRLLEEQIAANNERMQDFDD